MPHLQDFDTQVFRRGSALVLVEEAAIPSTAIGRVSPRRFRRHRVLRTQSARIALAPFVAGTDYEVLTNGEFSLLDAILVLLDRSGPADVTISTYSAGLYDAEVINRFIETKHIRSLRLVLDVAFKSLAGSRNYAVTLMDVFGESCIRTTRTHAKFVTITNETHAFSISSTANLNENKRLELFAFSDDPERAAWFDSIVNDLFDTIRPGWNPNTGAPGLHRLCDDPATIQMGTVAVSMGVG